MVKLKVVIIENVLVKNYILLKYFKNLFFCFVIKLTK